MSRTQAVMAVLRQELQRRQAALDASDGLVTLTITVKLVPDTEHVRGVVWQEARIAPRLPRKVEV